MLNAAMIDEDFKRSIVALLFEIDPWHRCERADGSIYAEGGLANNCEHCRATAVDPQGHRTDQGP